MLPLWSPDLASEEVVPVALRQSALTWPGLPQAVHQSSARQAMLLLCEGQGLTVLLGVAMH